MDISNAIEVHCPGLFSLTEQEIQAKILGPIVQQALTYKPVTVITFQNAYEKKFVNLGSSNEKVDFLVDSQIKMYENTWKKKYHKSYIFISHATHYNVQYWVYMMNSHL